MKKLHFAAALAAALLAAACTPKGPPIPGPSPTDTGRGDECPRADGLPCR